MQFKESPVPGVYEVTVERLEDDRGWFARLWCAEEFAARGLETRSVQCNVSFNRRRRTLRGMHYQAAPWGEAKVIRVTRGAVYDVALDLRTDSPTYCKWQAFELTADGDRLLYLPAGVAHGFLTLVDETEVFYLMSQFYHADAARGVRWNDPAFGIDWPFEPAVISERDRTFEDFAE